MAAPERQRVSTRAAGIAIAWLAAPLRARALGAGRSRARGRARRPRARGPRPPADRAGFVAVYPFGSGRLSDRVLLTWKAGACCGYAARAQVDDVGATLAWLEAGARRMPVGPSLLGRPSALVDASSVLWDTLARHRRPDAPPLPSADD